MKSAEHDIAEQDRLRAYEAEKQSWIEQHPSSTPREYELAMQQIAKRCGV